MGERIKNLIGRITKKHILIILCALLALIIVAGAASLTVNAVVKGSTADRIISSASAAELDGVDCILVLGCLVRADGSPSDMLADRLTRAIELYELGASQKLLMSGDHGQKEYNEVGAMKHFATQAGIPSDDIFMDHAGFSTYESIYRAKEVFGVDKIIIVTQEYHLPRALYIAEKLGIEAYGVSSDYRSYRGQTMRDIREIAARSKDFLFTVFKPEPTFLGDKIDISTNGDITND